MRALKIVSGVAVLLMAIHFIHAMHHFYSMSTVHGGGFWLPMIAAALVDLLTFVGGVLLLSGR